MNSIKHILISFSFLLLYSCGGSLVPSTPTKEMKQQFESKYAYTVLLADMDLKNDQFKHKYTIIDIDSTHTVTSRQTDWKNVNDDFFYQHEANLGMEILSKSPDKKINNIVSPPGFTNFIGNPNYGVWNELGTWEFNDKYKGLSKDLEIENLPIYKKEYVDFLMKYKYNKPHYGEKTHGDSTKYGTRSHHWFFYRPLFYSRRMSHRNFSKPRSFFNTSGNRGGGGFGK